MHVLVTGGAGFIGSHLVEYHLNKGDQVHAVDDLSTGSLDNLTPFANSPAFRFDKADIITWNGLEKSVAWADRIYHMAAVVGIYKVLAEPIKVVATNIAGCERVLRAVAASGWQPRVLIASSSEVYGHSEKPKFKETDSLIMESGIDGRWNYAISKLADEALGLAYARKLHLPITSIRFFNTTGLRQTGRYGMVVPRFVEQACHNEPITVYGDGNQTRSFSDIRDVVRSLDLLGENKDSIGEIVNVGGDREISIKELAEIVRTRAKSKSKIQFLSYEEAYGEKFIDILRRRPDLTRFLELTHYTPKWSLEQTIDDLILQEQQKTSHS